MRQEKIKEMEELLYQKFRQVELEAVKEFAKKLKGTSFRMFSNSNEEFIYAQNVDVLLNELLAEKIAN